MNLFNHRLISIFFCVTYTVLLTACFGGSTSVPDDNYYRLPEIPGKKMIDPVLTGSLSIKKVITHGIYNERTLVYTDKNTNIKLNRYYYHHWEKSPSMLIQDNLTQYLKSTGIAENVFSQTQNTSANYLLETELISMHRDMTSNPYLAVITINIKLYDKLKNSLVINQRYHSEISVNSNDLIDTVKAYGVGFKNIYDEFISDVNKI